MASVLRACGLVACLLLLVLATAAEACPKGTRYSPYAKNCYTGTVSDLKIWVKCTRHRLRCPDGKVRQEVLDKGNVICCGTTSDKYKFEPVFGEGPEFAFLACYWNGTAPFCDGSCKRGEIAKSASKDGRNTGKFRRSFGEPCVSGLKHLCCQNTHPGR
jgi:hypothetical protein